MSQPLPVPLWRAAALARRAAWRLRPVTPRPAPPVPERPARVGIVVSEAAKWGLGSLVRRLEADRDFEVRLYPTLSDVGLRMPREARRAAYLEQRRFFQTVAPIQADLYDPVRDRMAPLGAIDCDIAFVQQPWGMRDLPRRLSGRVRTAYVHYGMPVISNDSMQFGLRDFHPFLWRHFVPTQVHAEPVALAGGHRPPHVRVVGHPKLDAYAEPPPLRDIPPWPRGPERRRVIFAPHHGLHPGSLGLGTFAWSGPAMMRLMRRHPEIDVLLRPHPLMEIGLRRAGLMGARGWADYKAEWASMPNGAISEGGGYMDAFRTSDAMITDSGSFLAEYLPTGAPLIRLEWPGAAPLNSFGALLADGFYRTEDAVGLERLFAEIVVARADPLAAARARAAARLMPFDRTSDEMIVDELRRIWSETAE